MPHADHGGVIVAGGGLVGATLAVALDRAGIGCTLVDADVLAPPGAQAGARSSERPIAIGEGTRRVLDTLGVWNAMAAFATPIETVHVSERGKFGVTRIAARDHAVAALGRVTPAAAIADALDAALSSAHCGVRRIVPGVAADAQVHAGGVTVEVETPGDACEAIAGSLLVLADGGRSPLRARLGVRVRSRPYRARAIIASVSTEHPHRNIAYERFTPTGPLAMLPLEFAAGPGEGRCALVWTVDEAGADRLASLPDGEFLARLAAAFGGRLGRLLAVSERASFSLSLERADDTGVARAVAIGSASQRLHPVAGQGFNLGVRDAAWLAERLARAAREGEDLGGQALLAAYRNARARDRREVLRLTDTLARAFARGLGPLGPARSAGLLALDLLPGARRRFSARLMGLGGGFSGPASALSRGIGFGA